MTPIVITATMLHEPGSKPSPNVLVREGSAHAIDAKVKRDSLKYLLQRLSGKAGFHVGLFIGI